MANRAHQLSPINTITDQGNLGFRIPIPFPITKNAIGGVRPHPAGLVAPMSSLGLILDAQGPRMQLGEGMDDAMITGLPSVAGLDAASANGTLGQVGQQGMSALDTLMAQTPQAVQSLYNDMVHYEAPPIQMPIRQFPGTLDLSGQGAVQNFPEGTFPTQGPPAPAEKPNGNGSPSAPPISQPNFQNPVQSSWDMERYFNPPQAKAPVASKPQATAEGATKSQPASNQQQGTDIQGLMGLMMQLMGQQGTNTVNAIESAGRKKSGIVRRDISGNDMADPNRPARGLDLWHQNNPGFEQGMSYQEGLRNNARQRTTNDLLAQAARRRQLAEESAKTRKANKSNRA